MKKAQIFNTTTFKIITEFLGNSAINQEDIILRIKKIMIKAKIPREYFLSVMIEDGKLLLCSTHRRPIVIDSELKNWRAYTEATPARCMLGRNETGHYLPSSSTHS